MLKLLAKMVKWVGILLLELWMEMRIKGMKIRSKVGGHVDMNE